MSKSKSKKHTPETSGTDEPKDPWAVTKSLVDFFLDENTPLDETVFDEPSYARASGRANFNAAKIDYPWLARYWLSNHLLQALCKVWVETFDPIMKTTRNERDAARAADQAMKDKRDEYRSRWP